MFDTKFTEMSATELLSSMTYEDIRDASNSDLKEVKKVLYKLNSMANKRRARLQRVGSPWAQDMQHHSAAKIRDINDAKKEFAKVMRDLKNPYKSLKGIDEMRRKSNKALKAALLPQTGKTPQKTTRTIQERENKEQEKRIMEAINKLTDKNLYDKVWRAWEELKSRVPGLSNEVKYKIILKAIRIASTKKGESMQVTELADRLEIWAHSYTVGVEDLETFAATFSDLAKSTPGGVSKALELERYLEDTERQKFEKVNPLR